MDIEIDFGIGDIKNVLIEDMLDSYGIGHIGSYPVLVKDAEADREYEIMIDWIRPATKTEKNALNGDVIAYGNIVSDLTPPFHPGDRFIAEIVRESLSPEKNTNFLCHVNKVPVFVRGFIKKPKSKIKGRKYEIEIDSVAKDIKKNYSAKAMPLETIEMVKDDFPDALTLPEIGNISEGQKLFVFSEKISKYGNASVFHFDRKVYLIKNELPPFYGVVEVRDIKERFGFAETLKRYDLI